ncbi:hypothetical protein AB0H83_07450 [Dactylosporangium sp. NPDC050688]|uniref:hypothetical protein n=1 Tax=Dactylosporangium sp. NPDC050688 TaxID=3157217 RepID=UPI003401707C
MSEVGERARAALPAVALLTLATAAVLGLATLTGIAPAPPVWQIALTLVAGLLLGVAATDQVRAALTDWQGAAAAEAGSHRRTRRAAAQPGAGAADLPGTGTAAAVAVLDEPPLEKPRPPRPERPSWSRIGIIALVVAALVALLWVPQVPVHGVAAAVFTFVFGYAAYVLPVLPLLLLWPLPRLPRATWPWQLPLVPFVDRRLWTGAELRDLAVATLQYLRERVLTRTTGIALATLGLLHLVRGNPSLFDGGTSRAGGLVGWLLAEPLRLLLATGGAIGLLGGILVGAGAVIAASVGRAWGTVAGYAVLAVAVAVPLLGTGAGHWLGFEYYLRTEQGRVVVVAGLSPSHRQAVHDTAVAADGLSPSLLALLDKGLQVTGNDDGDRIARALADPSKAAADIYVGDQFELKAGECFDWIGGSSQLRYVTPCNAAHIGEVTYVGHLPFLEDPGRDAVDAAAKAVCEQSYGAYLGVPYGQSFLPLDKPMLPPGWTPRPIIACSVGSVGPWTLKGSRTVAALQQKVPWGAAGGCKVEVPDALRVTAEQPNTRCVAPGPEQRLTVPGGGFAMDLEFAAIGKAAGGAKIGAACLDGADLGNGYTFEVGADGVIEIFKLVGGQPAKLGASAKPKNAGPPTTASTPLQVTCKPTADGGIELTAFSTGNRKATAVDRTNPVTRLSPRLMLANAATGGVVMTAMIFNATRV